MTAMVTAYLECAAWCAQHFAEASEDQHGLPDALGRGMGEFTVSEDELRSLFSLDAILLAADECRGFCDYVADVLEESGSDHHPGDGANRAAVDALDAMDAGQAGHDFYLTRNGHGVGFWDRGLGSAGTRLSDAARTFVGDSEIVITYDGLEYRA
jgi:hypothetical protein